MRSVTPRTAGSRLRPGPPRCRARCGTRRMPSRSGRIGSASMKSRRSGVQPGGSYGNSMNGPPPTPGRDVEIGQEADPVRPRVRGEPAAFGERQLPDRPRRVDIPPARTTSGWWTSKASASRAASELARTSASSRRRRSGRPGTDARSAARPARSAPSSGSSSHRTSSSARPRRDRARGDQIDRRRRVAGHPPALVEIDHDRHRVADGGAGRRDRRDAPPRAGADRPGSSGPGTPPRGAAARTPPGPRPAAAFRTRRRRGCRPTRRRTASRPAALRPGRRCPTARPRAASTGRRGSRSSRAPGRGGRSASGSCPMNRCSNASKPSIVSPDPIPTIALVGLDADDRRQERPARDRIPGGLERRVEGLDRRSSRIAVIFTSGSIAQSRSK